MNKTSLLAQIAKPPAVLPHAFQVTIRQFQVNIRQEYHDTIEYVCAQLTKKKIGLTNFEEIPRQLLFSDVIYEKWFSVLLTKRTYNR